MDIAIYCEMVSNDKAKQGSPNIDRALGIYTHTVRYMCFGSEVSLRVPFEQSRFRICL